MKIKIINGEFSKNEALDLIAKMIQIKIEFHENKIKNIYAEEDIKFREEKIKKLQKDLAELRNQLKIDTKVFVDSEILLVDKN
jgi:hypothetical protein